MSAKKPTALKMIQGNPGKRKLNTNEPVPPGDVRKPYGFVKHHPNLAKRWDDIAAVLMPLGLLTPADVLAFRLMLTHYQFAVEAANEVERIGLTRKDENGVERKHPMLQIFRDNSNMFHKWATEFGLSPVARSKIEVAPNQDGQTLADLLFKVINDESEVDDGGI